MKKELHLSPISSLPPITPADHEFAMQVKSEYNKLPFDEICWLIRDVRNTLQDGYSETKKDSRLRDTYEKLFASDVEIKGITINTNKGNVYINSDASMFDDYFLGQIKRINSEFADNINSQDDYLRSWSKQEALLKTSYYLSDAELGPFQKGVVIGMFIIHFILNKGKPAFTDQEFNTEQSKGNLLGYLDYKHYLVELADRRLKKYSSDPNT